MWKIGKVNTGRLDETLGTDRTLLKNTLGGDCTASDSKFSCELDDDSLMGLHAQEGTHTFQTIYLVVEIGEGWMCAISSTVWRIGRKHAAQ